MSLEKHNKSQACEVQKLIDREKWYLSEELGYNCTSTGLGRSMLNNRISYIITSGFGAFMADLDATEDI